MSQEQKDKYFDLLISEVNPNMNGEYVFQWILNLDSYDIFANYLYNKIIVGHDNGYGYHDIFDIFWEDQERFKQTLDFDCVEAYLLDKNL